ncbi:MAG: hypothetical protein HOL85_23400 [Rhodospirillaceae bacterium]|jgi:hypothetical protein|nr:hypothetical protein [Rhodospirillaceae bacterium]MBT6138870.1 hypothetical protein [Rhodospirillaceae bacterium]
MRNMFRIIGWILVAAAVGVLVRDLYAWATGGAMMMTDTGQLWFSLHRDSLQLAEPAIARHVHPYLWHPIITSVLLTPAFVVLGVMGLLLILVTRGRNRGRKRSNELFIE